MSDKIQKIESALEAGIAMARQRGYKIRPGDWGVIVDGVDTAAATWVSEAKVMGYSGSPCLCPMACLIVDSKARHSFEEPETAAARVLDCSRDDVLSFITGFDGEIDHTLNGESDDFYALGRKFRERVLGGS